MSRKRPFLELFAVTALVLALASSAVHGQEMVLDYYLT